MGGFPTRAMAVLNFLLLPPLQGKEEEEEEEEGGGGGGEGRGGGEGEGEGRGGGGRRGRKICFFTIFSS